MVERRCQYCGVSVPPLDREHPLLEPHIVRLCENCDRDIRKCAAWEKARGLPIAEGYEDHYSALVDRAIANPLRSPETREWTDLPGLLRRADERGG